MLSKVVYSGVNWRPRHQSSSSRSLLTMLPHMHIMPCSAYLEPGLAVMTLVTARGPAKPDCAGLLDEAALEAPLPAVESKSSERSLRTE